MSEFFNQNEFGIIRLANNARKLINYTYDGIKSGKLQELIIDIDFDGDRLTVWGRCGIHGTENLLDYIQYEHIHYYRLVVFLNRCIGYKQIDREDLYHTWFADFAEQTDGRIHLEPVYEGDFPEGHLDIKVTITNESV